MKALHDFQPSSHPLKWKYLKEIVEGIQGMENPDIYIEDIRRYGTCSHAKVINIDPKGEDTDAIEASFSVIRDENNNRIIIRHHY